MQTARLAYESEDWRKALPGRSRSTPTIHRLVIEKMYSLKRMIEEPPVRKRWRRAPGEEPEFPANLKRRYRRPLSGFRLPALDVASVRARVGLSQEEFAHCFAFPVGTLRHWEQGTRRPRGAALALLHVIACNPAVATRAIMRARREALDARLAARLAGARTVDD